jgi:hypothetical protein
MVNVPTTLKYICGIALGLFLVTSALHLNAYAKPEVSISPSCGPKSGFNVLIKAKGFAADSIASWKLVDSDGNAPLTGYFHTDSNGEVKDHTSIDDVKKGHYKLYFGDDKNNDGELGSEVSQSDITIPCQNK